MEIRFISSLTAEDEGLFAPALLKSIGALLDQLPIAYTLRIETSGAQVFQHSHAIAHDPAKPDSVESLLNSNRSVAYPTRLTRLSNGS